MNRVGDVGLALAILLMFATLGTVLVRGCLRRHRPGRLRHGHRDRAAAAARRLRQVRPGPAAGLAAGRHGGPDPGLGAHPRRDHGHRRRVPDRALAPIYDLTETAPPGRRHRRHGHAARRRDHRLRQGRHQEGAGRLDRQPDRLHVPGRGLGPAGYALAILHLLTHGFFKAGLFLGAGSVMHAMNDDVDMRRYGGLRSMPITFIRPRLPGDHRLPAVRRVLLQGRDHRGRLRRRPSTGCCSGRPR